MNLIKKHSKSPLLAFIGIWPGFAPLGYLNNSRTKSIDVDNEKSLLVRKCFGNDIVGINTFEEQAPLGNRKKGDRLIVDSKLPLYFAAGSYSVSPGFSYDPSEPGYLEWIDNAVLFEMEKPLSGKQICGFTYIPNQVSAQLVK